MNAGERYFHVLGDLPVTAAITGVSTNTRKTKHHLRRTQHHRAPGRFGVLDLMAEFALTKDEALVVSDHMPVWAVFSAVENPIYCRYVPLDETPFHSPGSQASGSPKRPRIPLSDAFRAE